MPRSSTPSSRSRTPQHRPAATTAILVLGMHRSGTSAIARLLNLRGADLGRDLLPPKQDNERGFWENASILALHEELLRRQQWHWYDLLTPGMHWLQEAPARKFVADLPAVLAQQFAGSGLFLIKDPRLSLLAPLWIETLAAQHVRPVFVITIRNPDEVAASLARRDGFPHAQSQLLWLQHLIEAERSTRGRPRVFIHYERLLADWRGELKRVGEQLDLAWPTQPAHFEADVARFIAPALRHHQSGDAANSRLPEIVQRVYQRACAAAADAAPAAASFDDASAGYDQLVQLAAPLYRDLAAQRERANEQYNGEITNARSNINALAAELAQAREAHAARDQTESELRTALLDRDIQIERARAAFNALSAELDAARANIDALTAEIDQARDAFVSKEQEIDVARSQAEALVADLEQLRDAYEAACANIDALAGDIERAREGFAAKDAEIDAARRNIDNLVAEIERARQAHSARDAAEAALRQTRWYRLGRGLRLIGGNDS